MSHRISLKDTPKKTWKLAESGKSWCLWSACDEGYAGRVSRSLQLLIIISTNMKKYIDEIKTAASKAILYLTQHIFARAKAEGVILHELERVATAYRATLRQGVRRGLYYRIKQGLYPGRAPLGYLDTGSGKAKAIDPVMGPLIRKAFKLCGSGRYNLKTLGEKLHRLGLRNRGGNRMTKYGLSSLFRNSFYFGVITIPETGETFAGIHRPLIERRLFHRVQAVLNEKVMTKQ